ncbi:MAG: thioredoxin fold domain-containing protein [Pseudomonadota bacterium]
MIASVLRVVVLLSLAMPVLAADPAPSGKAEDAIRARLAVSLQGVEVSGIEPSPVPGLYHVLLDGTESAYVTADGTYLINGDMYQAGGKKLVNITDQRKGGQRREVLARLDRRDLVTFPATGAEKAFIYVFTDVDCGYCRKFHQEVPKLNAAGVTVHYLAFPRAGLEGDTFRKMESVWCAGDRNKALTAAKRGVVPVPAPVACKSPVAAEYRTGVGLGVRGTPAVFLADGNQVGGYLPAKELLARLGLK